MSLRLAALAAAVCAGVPAATVSAQGGRTCFVVVDRTGGVQQQVDVGGGHVRWYSGGGVWAHCRGQATSWYSDSVAWYQDQDRFEMIGHVDFRDSTARLVADRATYYLGQERLDANGNARLRNVASGSILRGPTLTYLRRIPVVRETTELNACRRPTIEYRSASDPADAEPYVIVADCVWLLGNSATRARGQVTIDRTDFHARGDSATLDTDLGVGQLFGNASVSGGEAASYRLTGRDVRFRLAERALVWVQAEGNADAVSAEWRLVADTVQFDLRDDRIQRGNAWGDSLRPEATSLATVMVADSLAISSPDQVLDEVRGIGAAHARSRQDTTDTDPDWVAGDTVTARFEMGQAGGRTLAEVLALGNARARYRVYAPGRADGLPDLSYSRGDRILARFANERLLRVDVTGNADGVYLEAPRRVP
jgi:hypothetical protein